MRKYLRISEYVWLTLSVMCLGITGYLFFTGYKDEGGFAMLISAIAIIMYLMRRRFNRILLRAEEKERQGKG